MGNRILLINFIVRMAAKSPFCLPSILLPEAMDKSGTPLRLMLRPPSFYQCPICQVLSSGLDGTWQQPKGVECGILKIANYNSSWIDLLFTATLQLNFELHKPIWCKSSDGKRNKNHPKPPKKIRNFCHPWRVKNNENYSNLLWSAPGERGSQSVIHTW